ncbi:rod shape-determining protein, partial [bacterium]|nr:rod shape-determining protein [bacterium]
AMFHNGFIRHTAIVACGGDYITRDIAVGLRTPMESAEQIKIQHGAAHLRAIGQNEFLEIPGVGGREPREMSRSMLVSIIAPRVEEILNMARDELSRSRTLDYLGAGLVLTGGGASMPGMSEIAEEIFTLPVRIGSPRDSLTEDSPTLGPKFSTAVGLVRYAQRQAINGAAQMNGGSNWARQTTGRLRNWLQGVF